MGMSLNFYKQLHEVAETVIPYIDKSQYINGKNVIRTYGRTRTHHYFQSSLDR